MTSGDREPIDIDAMMAEIRSRLALQATPRTEPSRRPLDGDELMRRVQAELARRTPGAVPQGAVADDAAGSSALERWQPVVSWLPIRQAYELPQLLAFSDADFIQNAYRALLHRFPDEAGQRHYLAALRDGHLSKIEVLGALRWSAEGEARSVHVDGLLLPYLLRKWQRRPVIGPLIGWAHGLLRLNRIDERLQNIDTAQARAVHEIGALANRHAAEIERLFGGIRVSMEADAQQLRTDMATAAEAQARQRKAMEQRVQAEVAAAHEAQGARILSLGGEIERLKELPARLSALELAWAEVSQVREWAERMAGDMRQRVDEASEELQRLRQSFSLQADAVAPLLRRELNAETAMHALDPLYAAFEDQFRGPRDLVRARVLPYLQQVADAGAGSAEAPVLDLGSGRGEWLELLREQGLHGRGIDINRVFIEACSEAGLAVQEADVIDAMTELPEASVGAVTSMHLVEHLPFEKMIALIDQSLRVLKQGGVLILETPNPENLQVAAHWFYQDPTHRNPLPPEALRWLVEARGFTDVRIERLTSDRYFDAPELLPADMPGAASLNAVISQYRAATDYAIIARRP